MDDDNPFDKKIELLRRTSGALGDGEFLDAACFVTDSMELAQKSAESLFPNDEITPELVLAIYDRFVQHRQS